MSKYNITNLAKFTQEIKPINFIEENVINIENHKNNAIENKLKELLKPYLDIEYHEFKAYELIKVEKNLAEHGYKIGCIEDEHYQTYYIKNKISKDIDYFLVKRGFDVKSNKNQFTAKIYISDIIRDIKNKF